MQARLTILAFAALVAGCALAPPAIAKPAPPVRVQEPGTTLPGPRVATVGVINLNRAVQELEESKRVAAGLRADLARLKKELEGEVAAVKAERARLGKTDQAGAAVLAKREREAQQKADVAVEELKKREAEATQRMVGVVASAAAAIAQETGLALVVDSGGVVWAPIAADLTPEVIRRCNATTAGPGK